MPIWHHHPLSLSLQISNMGFPSLCYCTILPKPIILTFQFLDLLRYVISLFFFRIGLANSVEYCPLMSLSSTIDCLTESPSSAIKSRLRLVKLKNLQSKKGKHDQTVVCAVCLGQLNACHEVRELGNCSHLFHRECIDKWVDLGKVTCPLCRCLLLPRALGGIEGERGCFDLVRWWNWLLDELICVGGEIKLVELIWKLMIYSK